MTPTPPTVILVRPREEGNVGAVARAMANMGLERLVLVEPAPALGGVARGFGVGGWEILDGAERAASFADAAAPFGRVVGTASRRDRPLSRQRVVTARELPEVLAADGDGTRTALVFGPEDHGLTRRELERCDPVVTVPCDPGHPTLNLAQAVLIVAYELHLATAGAGPGAGDGRDPVASAGEVDALRRQLAAALPAIGFDHPPIQAALLRDLLQLVARAGATSREVRILRRLCNRVSGLAKRTATPQRAGGPE